MNKFAFKHFIDVGSKLCMDACHLVDKSYRNQNLKKFMKGIDDPVTQADFKVQALLTHGFMKSFPFVPIIGQESLETDINLLNGQIQDTLHYSSNEISSLGKLLSNFDSIALQKEILQLDYANGPCIWIDPIDCTRGFINGYAQDVTILIGMSIGKKSRIGIIGTPFKRNLDGQLVFDPSITVGSIDLKQAYTLTPSQSNQWNILNNPYLTSTYGRNLQKKAVTSLKISQRQDSIINSLGVQRLRAGGSGRKINMIAKKAADIMLFIDSQCGKWDSCAGQAIIKSLGGFFTNYQGQQIKYDHEKVDIYGKQEAINKKGMVCSLDKYIHYETLELINKYDNVKRDQSSNHNVKNYHPIQKIVVQTA